MENIHSLLKAKGLNVEKSESGKIINKFNESPAAGVLWDFISIHPSCRAVFNALLKTDFVNLDAALLKLPELLKQANTSFVFRINCKKCEKVLDVPNIAYSNFKFPDAKEITCPECKTKNKISTEEYKPVFELGINDLIKFLQVGCERGLFSPVTLSECHHCGFKKVLNTKIVSNCPKCKKVMHVSTQYAPSHDKEIKEISSDGQGYWLEWYIWRSLKLNKEFETDCGLKITTKDEKIEADVIITFKKMILAIECKDGSDDAKFLRNLITIKKFIDYFVLVTTNDLNKKTIETAKKLMGKRFILVTSDKIEKLSEEVRKLRAIKRK